MQVYAPKTLSWTLLEITVAQTTVDSAEVTDVICIQEENSNVAGAHLNIRVLMALLHAFSINPK
jgi:hypothetical protein